MPRRSSLLSIVRAPRHRTQAARLLAEFRTAGGFQGRARLRLLSARQEPLGARLVYLAETREADFVLKLHTAREGDPLGRDHAGLKRIAGVFGATGPFTVPVPLFRAASGRGFVMSRFDGVMASRFFLTGPDPATRCDAFRRAGRWLGMLHRSEPPEAGVFRPKWVLGEIARQCRENPRAYPALAEPGEVAALVAAVRRQLQPFRAAPVLSVSSHGDYSAHNLLLGTDRTCGIDFGYAGTRNAIADIADFLIFDLMFPHAPGRLGPGGVQADSHAAFAEGYGEIADAEVLNALLRARILLKWLSIRRKRGRSHPDFGFRPEEARTRLRLLLET